MSEYRPFHRPQRPFWWARAPYRGYSLRELSGVGVALYGAVLLAGLACLWRGPAAFASYRAWLATPGSLLLHLLLLAAMLLHMVTWFQTLPKTMPKLIIGGVAVPQRRITALGLATALLCCAALLGAAIGAAS
jgi:fumarate reductase subunit C